MSLFPGGKVEVVVALEARFFYFTSVIPIAFNFTIMEKKN